MPEPVEWVDHDSEDVVDTSPRRGRSRRRPIVLGLVALVVIALVVVAIMRNGNGSGHPRAATTPTRPLLSRVTPSGPAPLSPTRVALPPPTVRDVGHRLLGVRGGWELFGRGDGVVVRIELARGRITTTRIPPLLSTGPVSFLAAGDAAIVRPLDLVPGYVVPDEARPRRAAGAIGPGGLALPGPQPGQVWATSDRRSEVLLVDGRGRPVSPQISIRTPANGFPDSDRAGYVLIRVAGGYYDVRPGGRILITRGRLLAAGPTRWLTQDCQHGDHCVATVINRRTGSKRSLPKPPRTVSEYVGSISPDGSRAALITNEFRIDLLDFASGDVTPLPMGIDPREPLDEWSRIVWSPDSRWLFVVHAGRLSAVNARTHRVRSLGVRLPPLVQIAIRPG